jgi:xanthine/CO dehydrogenase XdhC/CoxF family maturation factor
MAEAKEQEKLAVTLPGTVEKIIPANQVAPEKAQIAVEGAEHLYREIRVDNTLEDSEGEKVGLKPGARVEVTIEAEKDATVRKDKR